MSDPLGTPTNADRIERGRAIINEYINAHGGDNEHGCTLTDILADLMHMHAEDRNDGDAGYSPIFDDHVNMARIHFEAEHGADETPIGRALDAAHAQYVEDKRRPD